MGYETNVPVAECAAEPKESLASVLADALNRIRALEDQVEYLNAKLNTRQGRNELAVELEHHILARIQNHTGRRR